MGAVLVPLLVPQTKGPRKRGREGDTVNCQALANPLDEKIEYLTAPGKHTAILGALARRKDVRSSLFQILGYDMPNVVR